MPTTSGSSMPVPQRLTREEITSRIRKRLRKRQGKTAAELAEEAEVPVKAMPHSLALLIRSGEAVSDGARKPRYTKA